MESEKSTKIYLDANIYLDYLEERKDSVRPLDEFAFQLFKRAIKCEFRIAISALVIEEVERNLSFLGQFQKLLESLSSVGKLEKVFILEEDKVKARKFGNFADALHAVAARKAGCKFLVTRNIEHFLCFSGLIEPVLPENL